MRMRIIALCLLFALLLPGLCACRDASVEEKKEVETLDIYASCFPIYAIAERLTRGVPDLRLHCLMQPQDGSLRSYELSNWDAALLSKADAVLMGGDGFESFASLLNGAGESGPAVVQLFADVELKTTQNNYVYMFTSGMEDLSQRITESLAILDPRYGDTYRKNLHELLKELTGYEELQKSVRAVTEGRSVIVMNEALVNVADDYGFETVLCMERESGEALYDEALEACINSLTASGCRTILIEKQCPAALHKALEKVGFALVLLDTLSTGRSAEGFDGMLSRLTYNAQALEKAFETEKEETVK